MTSPSPQAQKWALHAANLIGSGEFGTVLHSERFQIIAEAIDEALASTLVDADIGRAWREDSSLEKWFPFTADEVHALRMRTAEMRTKIDAMQKILNAMRCDFVWEEFLGKTTPKHREDCARCAWEKLKKEL